MSLQLDDIYPIVKEQFPAQNDYYSCSYQEEFVELLHFSIDTKEKLTTLLETHKEALLEADASIELDEVTYDYFCDEMGKAVIDERLENKFWYSYPAFIRLALNFEDMVSHFVVNVFVMIF